MLVAAVVVWLVCGTVNELLVYEWAGRPFGLRDFAMFFVFGPVFLLAFGLLVTMGVVMSARGGDSPLPPTRDSRPELTPGAPVSPEFTS